MESSTEWPIQIHSSELIAGLSRALDLTEGEPMGHSHSRLLDWNANRGKISVGRRYRQ